MSFDTTTRVDSYMGSAVATPNNITIIYEDKNEGIFERGGGPFIKVWTEASFDDPTGIRNGQNVCFTEDGIVIIQIYIVSGYGNKDLYKLEKVADLIKEAFRGVELIPTGSEEGIILFEDFTTRQTITIDNTFDGRSGSRNDFLPYKRKDIFINYQKNY